MVKPQHCAKEEVLVPAAAAGGISEILIAQLPDEKCYVLSVKLERTRQRIYLATRRNQNEPRTFKRIDVAIGVANRLFGTKKFTVVIP